jgi:hypothetical protein
MKKVLHLAHHKCMTAYFTQLLERVAAKSGKTIVQNDEAYWPENAHVMVSWNGAVSLKTVPHDAVISHVVRDPRDMIVSGYFYHLWCKEAWCQVPDEQFGGRSYQEYLNAVSKSEGLEAEITRSSYNMSRLVRWANEKSRQVFHIRYEEIFGNELEVISPLLDAWELDNGEREVAVKTVTNLSFSGMKAAGIVGKGRHARQGYPGDWANHFETAHIELFKSKYKGVLEELGYN